MSALGLIVICTRATRVPKDLQSGRSKLVCPAQQINQKGVSRLPGDYYAEDQTRITCRPFFLDLSDLLSPWFLHGKDHDVMHLDKF